jgi:hypothetical protein
MKDYRSVYVGVLLAVLSFNVMPVDAANVSKNVSKTYGRLALRFEVNRGQADSRAQYLARGAGYTVLLTPTEAIINLRRARQQKYVRMRLVNASASAQPSASEMLETRSNYFLGKDPRRWLSNVANYGRVTYAQVYPGIDAVYYGKNGDLEYDLVVAPGSDPTAIQIEFEGAQSTSLTAEGDVTLHLGGGSLVQHRPVIYQQVDGVRRDVTGHYLQLSKDRYGIKLGDYDRSRELIIDPKLSYSTYLGGDGFDEGVGIAVDSSGNAYVTGWAGSTNFPTTPGSNQAGFGGGSFIGDVFVTKLNATGTSQIYSTYLGGDFEDSGWSIAVDASGNAYVTGYTESSNFPTTPGAYKTTLTGSRNAFVTKLNAAGNALVYSSYLGGTAQDHGLGIAVDSYGFAYIGGRTSSPDFPTTAGAYQTVLAGNTDAFAVKMNATGTALVYSTFIGGSGFDIANGMAIDGSGNAYLAGYTQSANFPTSTGAAQTIFGGAGAEVGDAFVTKLNSTGAAVVYSTYVGGSGDDYARGLAVDSSGFVYVAGRTMSANFPVTAGAAQTLYGGDGDAWSAKLNTTGSAFVYCTYIGGSQLDQAEGIAVDSLGNAYVGGMSRSTDFPLTADALQDTLRGFQNGIFTKLNASGTTKIHSTYLGGTSLDIVTSVAVDSSGNAYLNGASTASDFFVTPGAFQTVYGGGLADTVVAKVDFASMCSYSITPSSQNFPNGGGTGVATVTVPTGCPWLASSGVPWVTITSQNYGVANGSVSFSVASNPNSTPRSGTLAIAKQTFTVTQDGTTTCSFTLSPTAQTVTAKGGSFSVAVTAPGGCAWTAESNSPWITITSGQSGSGNGTVFYTVSPTTTAQSGSMTIAGNNFPITQTVPPDVSASVTITRSTLTYNSATKTYSGKITITNNTAQRINGPLQVLLQLNGSGIVLLNPSGSVGSDPYVTFTGGLNPSQSVTINVRFADPSTVKVFSGTF